MYQFSAAPGSWSNSYEVNVLSALTLEICAVPQKPSILCIILHINCHSILFLQLVYKKFNIPNHFMLTGNNTTHETLDTF